MVSFFINTKQKRREKELHYRDSKKGHYKFKKIAMQPFKY